jgi:hypothetical protein
VNRIVLLTSKCTTKRGRDMEKADDAASSSTVPRAGKKTRANAPAKTSQREARMEVGRSATQLAPAGFSTHMPVDHSYASSLSGSLPTLWDNAADAPSSVSRPDAPLARQLLQEAGSFASGVLCVLSISDCARVAYARLQPS